MYNYDIRDTMKDIKEILKGAVDKIKAAVEKEDIPLKDAYAQMDADLEEAEKAYGKPLFPQDDEQIPLDEHYLKILGFKDKDFTFDDIKTRYEELLNKFNPENFADDEAKQIKAAKKINLINQAYQYFEHKYTEESEK